MSAVRWRQYSLLPTTQTWRAELLNCARLSCRKAHSFSIHGEVNFFLIPECQKKNLWYWLSHFLILLLGCLHLWKAAMLTTIPPRQPFAFLRMPRSAKQMERGVTCIPLRRCSDGKHRLRLSSCSVALRSSSF